MSDARTFARRAVQAIRAPLPTGEGTLYVEGVPAMKMDDREGIRRLVAGYCIRTALEKGCTKIVVRHPRRTPITFDVVELLAQTSRYLGHWPVPRMKHVPANIASIGMLNYGATFDRVRPMITVPTTLVSGFESGEKETR